MTPQLEAIYDRLRQLESDAARSKGETQEKDRAMNETLDRIDEHLTTQDAKIDTLQAIVNKWGGALALAGFLVATAIAIIEFVRK